MFVCINLITIRTARVTFKVNFVVFLSPHLGFSSMQIVHKNSYLVKLQDIHGQIALWEVCKWKNCSLTIYMQQSKRNCSCCIEGQKKKQAESQVNERPSKHPQVWIYFLFKKKNRKRTTQRNLLIRMICKNIKMHLYLLKSLKSPYSLKQSFPIGEPQQAFTDEET